MAALREINLLRRPVLLSSPLLPFHLFPSPLSFRSQSRTSFVTCSSHSSKPSIGSKWKPTCLYYTQGKCTKSEDPLHLEKFSHSCSVQLGDSVSGSPNVLGQDYDYFLVLDLEGKVEVLEFPVLLFDTKTLDVVDVFHRFVRPTKMSQQRINEYIEGKYGMLGLDRVWHDTAIKFADVIEQFEGWLRKERVGGIALRQESGDGILHRAAFVTCGNWDLKTKIPDQCKVSGIELPPYFMEWINIKDIFLNFYNTRAPGMLSMMRHLHIPLLGSHHVGIDDSKNIARVLRRMLADGAHLQVTAKRARTSPHSVTFLFRNRI